MQIKERIEIDFKINFFMKKTKNSFTKILKKWLKCQYFNIKPKLFDFFKE